MSNNDFAESGPGKIQELIKVEGTHVKMPLTVITGEASGPTVFISTGLHGSEYPGTLAMIELARDLEPKDIRGRLIALHPVNGQAFWVRISSILPEDGRNLNSVFPGNPNGGVSEKTAWQIAGFQELADFYLDLHSGDLFEDLIPYVYYPLLGSPEVVEASRRAAAVLNVRYMTGTVNSAGSIVSAAKRGTPSLLIERGGAGQCLRVDVDLYKKDLINVFKHLGLMGGPPELPLSPPEELENVIYLESKFNALWQPAVSAGEKVKAGQHLGTLLDFFGKTVSGFTAERDGVVLYHLRTLAANTGDVLVAY